MSPRSQVIEVGAGGKKRKGRKYKEIKEFKAVLKLFLI